MLNLTIPVITRVVFAGQLDRRIKVSVQAAFEVTSLGWNKQLNYTTYAQQEHGISVLWNYWKTFD